MVGHRQTVKVAVNGTVLSYVWKGDVPLVIGDVVRVRNPDGRERDWVPSVKGTVVSLDSEYKGYLVIIQAKACDASNCYCDDPHTCRWHR